MKPTHIFHFILYMGVLPTYMDWIALHQLGTHGDQKKVDPLEPELEL